MQLRYLAVEVQSAKEENARLREQIATVSRLEEQLLAMQEKLEKIPELAIVSMPSQKTDK